MSKFDDPHISKYVEKLKAKMSEKGWYANKYEEFDNVDSMTIKFVKYGADKELIVVISGAEVRRLHQDNMDEMLLRKLAGFI